MSTASRLGSSPHRRVRQIPGEPPLAMRPATPRDFELLRRIQREAQREHVIRAVGRWDEAAQAERLRRHFHPENLWVIRAPGAEIGTVGFRLEGDSYVIENLLILPAHQRRGYGTRVLQSLLVQADRARVPVRLAVLKGSPARNLYERAGFVHTHDDPYWLHPSWRSSHCSSS